MRFLFTGCLALVLIVAVTPLQAQESWVLYDDFNGTRPLEPFLGKSIDPDKWEPRDSGTLYILDYAREIRSNQLHLLNRTHGLSLADFQVSTIVRLQFPGTVAPLVTAMRATVTVKSFEVTGGSGVLSRVRGGRLSGFFFNTGSGTGGGNSGDILAAIYIEGLSDSPQILRVVAHVEKCSDRDANPVYQTEVYPLFYWWNHTMYNDPEQDGVNGNERVYQENVEFDLSRYKPCAFNGPALLSSDASRTGTIL